MFFFVKQKTAYEMRISDWSSDVCSSDLQIVQFFGVAVADVAAGLVALPNDRSVVVGLITGCGMGKGRIRAPTVRSGEPNAALKQEHRRLIAAAAAAGHIVFVSIAFARPGFAHHDLAWPHLLIDTTPCCLDLVARHP